MLERDFPGCHVGPEPTTDRFMAVMHGKDERTIPGNAAAADMSKPFTALTKYGMAFLNKFEVCQLGRKGVEGNATPGGMQRQIGDGCAARACIWPWPRSLTPPSI